MSILERMDSLINNNQIVPTAVKDLTIYEEKFLGKDKYFLMSDEREKYLKLTASQYAFYKFILVYFDGRHLMEELDEALKHNIGTGYDAEKVVSILYSNNLLEERFEDNKTKVEIELSSKKIFDIPIDYFQVHHKKLIKILDYITQCIGVVSILYALILILFNQELIREVYKQTQLFSWRQIGVKDFMFIAILSILAIPIHECGHLIAANRYKVRWKRFVFALKWGINPVYYIRYYNFYSNKSRNKIVILLSGVYFNIIQAAVYFILLVHTYDWRMAVMSIINLGCIVSCLLPSGTSDGYHIISIIMDIEGIRWKMLKLIGDAIKKPKSISVMIKKKENIMLILYFSISYSLAIYGCYTLLNTVIDYLHIFSVDQYYTKQISTVCIIIVVCANILKFIKNLKNI